VVKPLLRPSRPLTARPGHRLTDTWHTTPRADSAIDALSWCRIYHREAHTPNGHVGRPFGPLYRFDHHEADASGEAQVDPLGRSVLYLGEDLLTCANEVFGEAEEAPLCPNFRIARIAPLRDLTLFDLQAPGAARSIGALPSLGSGNEKRNLTQEWARAIESDQPTGEQLNGILYRSAYHHGLAMALWDADNAVATAEDSTGQAWDRPLRDSRILPQLLTALATTPIVVRFVEAAHCRRCP
jgi:hypothetical protein